jgi:glycosyltransferase involved in cell wall biosynthesis
VLVVDDGSTDASVRIARAYGGPVRCLAEPARGVAAALNRGTEVARGEFLAFLDADDVWLPDKLALQLAALRAQSGLDGVFGHATNFRASRTALRTLPGYYRGSLLIRRESFEQVGPFVQWRLGEFVDWYARAVDAKLGFLMLPDVVVLRRVHDANTGVRLRGERDEYARVLKAVLDRRRSAPR